MTRPRSSHLLTILPLALGLGACVDNNADSGLTVLKVVPAESGCEFSTGGDRFQASGLIQSNSSAGYLIAPEVRNDLSLADGEQVTPKTVFITGAQVVIKFYDDDLFDATVEETMARDGVTRFVVPVAGSVEPNAGTAVIPFTAVPVELLRLIEENLRAKNLSDTLLDVQLQIIGTRGGSAIESNLFRYPVEVCIDCVVSNLGLCANLSGADTFGRGGACNPLQDGALDCCVGVDPDDREFPCQAGGDPPPAGFVCADGVDEAAPVICPAHPIQL